MISIFLNFPYTLLGIISALVTLSYSVKIHKNPFAIVFRTNHCWWGIGWYKYMRACTIGNVILLTQKELKNDFEHELVHIRQQERYPFIFWFMYLWETFRKGYKNNKYEVEAYKLSKSYFGKNPPKSFKL